MIFDSNEELHFSWWLEEMVSEGYIHSWERNVKSYSLTEDLKITYVVPMKRVPDKIKEQTLLSAREYTPDFVINWSMKSYGVFVQELEDGKKIKTPFISQNGVSVVETKGPFDRNNMTRLASTNIKDLYQRHKVYVTMIKIPNIFKKTFTPARYTRTDKTGKPRKLNYNVVLIKDFK